jgi:Ca-activated chloride channel homolog
MAAFESLTVAWPWLALALPLPWLLRAWWSEAPAEAALRVPGLDYFSVSALSGAGAPPDGRVRSVFHALIWILLVVAAMRPQSVDPAQPVPASGRDLVIALDTSASMGTEDMVRSGRRINRLAAARELAGAFIGRRDGDRVGLIVFGSQAYVHTPLSFDIQAVRATLGDVPLELAGRETAMGDAIALAVRRMREFSDSARVLVLISDGASNAGAVAPEQALWIAQREGVRIYTLGVGVRRMKAGTGELVREIDPSADLDETRLQRIAEVTGGFYRRATDLASMDDFFRQIDAQEPARFALRADLRPAMEWYPVPLAAALCIAIGGLFGRPGRRAG